MLTPLSYMQVALRKRPYGHMPEIWSAEAEAVLPPNSAPRRFHNNRNQAIISRDGDRLTTKPVRKNGNALAALLVSWEPLDEELSVIDDPPPAPKDIL